MPVDIQITDDDIQSAEQKLLPPGQKFDEERRAFIRNLQTIDLQAVPGSGKTTALLAKLLILERKLPFLDGSGILVISHTNAAVDEIKDKIAKDCPKLFSYPNFVGTIQGFVNDFLAKPYFAACFNRKLSKIDNVIYEEKIRTFYRKLHFSSPLRNWLKRKNIPADEFLSDIRMDRGGNLISKINGTPSDFILKNKDAATYKELVGMKRSFIEEGFLHFEDAYLLAARYLSRYPKVKKYLQKRFCLVFVDEMQDMDKHQYDLLEKLFFDNGLSQSSYQRIGDRNQAIYGEIKSDDYWKDRSLDLPDSRGIWYCVLRIERSYRLSPQIAAVVQHFALDNHYSINGLQDSGEIKPRMIIYDDVTKERVVPAFADIIRSFQETGLIPTETMGGQKPRFYAVAWSVEWTNPAQRGQTGRFRLEDFIAFNKVATDKNRVDYDSLECYLEFWDRQKQTLAPIHSNLINALLRILRFEGLKHRENGREREFTKGSLMKFLSRTHPEFYEVFKRNLYTWCMKLIQNHKHEVLQEIRNFLPEFVGKIDGNRLSVQTNGFINQTCSEIEGISEEDAGEAHSWNIKRYGDIAINIGSVHSVKGQTHTATLYIESYYGVGAGRNTNNGYESHRLAGCFNQEGEQIEGRVERQAAKMAYVGFSRPTHLLCFAVHKDRYERLDCAEHWEIHDLTTVADGDPLQ